VVREFSSETEGPGADKRRVGIHDVYLLYTIERQKALRIPAWPLVSPMPHVFPWKGIPHCIPRPPICRCLFLCRGSPVPLHLIQTGLRS
jgi:hypothetical protein